MLPHLIPRASRAHGCTWLAACVALLIGGFAMQAFGQGGGKEGRNRKEIADEGASMPFRPVDGSSVAQNPPDFSWPWRAAGVRYEVRLKGPDGRVHKLTTERNALSWPEGLVPGAYEWSVASAGDAGTPRRFTLAADAAAFLVPSDAELLKRAIDRPRPRYNPTDLPAARDAAVRVIVDRATAALGRSNAEPEALDRSARQTDRRAFAENKVKVKREGQASAQQLSEILFAWRLTGEAKFRDEAKRLLLEFTGWEIDGATGVGGVHGVASKLAWTMALAYDWLYADLSPELRQQVLGNLVQRVGALRQEFFAGDRMARKPYNSHGWVTWGHAAAALALMAGDDKRANDLFLDLVPGYFTSISPWGGEDGGFGNGTSYALSAVGHLVVPLDILSVTLGVNAYTKPWARNLGRFITYTYPPGAPEAPFGDGAEARYERVDGGSSKALAQRVDEPLIKWYAGKVSAEPPDPLILLAGSSKERRAPAFPGAPNSQLFADVGWATMHSDLSDPGRVSVYFISSPYGSFNHSHAAQNAFVIQAGGQTLAKSSGYYDSYASPHWKQWYQSTRAQNAITFDGGKGQPQQDMAAAGKIVAWSSAKEGDVVVGDATAAYAGALSRAVRTLVYLRPDVVLVHDELQSAQARQWEWNLHADNRLEGSDRSARIESGGQTLCVDVLEAPPTRFAQTNQFTADPERKRAGQRFPDQWHASFVAKEPSREAEFVVAMRVGCKGPVPTLARSADGAWTVSSGARRVQFGPGRASVQ